MYTEKVTLRLTQEDKDQLQNEADKKKLPLTTLIRNKVSGIDNDEANEEFEKQLIMFDEKEYNHAVWLSKEVLKKLNAVKQVAETIIQFPTEKKEIEGFIPNPVEFVKNAIYKQYKDKIDIPLNIDKLIELLGIDLRLLESKYKAFLTQKQHRATRLIVNESNELDFVVSESSFKHWTIDLASNKRLKLANTILNASKELNIPIGNIHRAYNPIFTITHTGDIYPNISWVNGNR